MAEYGQAFVHNPHSMHLSLSITASTPHNNSILSVFTTGIPPPPTAITILSLSTSCLITFFSIMSIGSGEGTTLLYPRPASSTN